MSGARERRQAVFILVDTQGANVVGAYRPELALGTPNLDRLAAEGVRFDAAYTCAPVCGPARSALMTGLYPHSNGVLGNDMAPHLDVPTLGQRLQQAGIRTGHIGKWHLDGSDYFGDGRCPVGWDPEFWFDGRNYLDSLGSEQERDLSRRVLGPEEVRRHGITSEFTHAHRTVDRAVEFLRRYRDEDFFLVVSIDEPHHPFICPEPFVSAFEDFRFPVANHVDSLEGKPLGQREWAEHVKAKVQEDMSESGLQFPAYFACNSYCDSQIGRVLAAVDEFAPGAMVIHTSDHGDMLGAHGLLGKGPVMYEEIARVPLIVRWPGRVPAGRVSTGPVSHIDFVPTVLEFFGVERPPLLQGRSLMRQLCNPEARVNKVVFAEFNRFEVDHDGFGAFAPIRSAFDGRYKLNLHLLDQDEFYDLAEDPHEMNNRIGEDSSERDRLFAEIIEWMDRTRDPLRGPHWKRRSWREEKAAKSWGGPTRPRPFDEAFYPRTLLYETGRVAERSVYEKD